MLMKLCKRSTQLAKFAARHASPTDTTDRDIMYRWAQKTPTLVNDDIQRCKRYLKSCNVTPILLMTAREVPGLRLAVFKK